MLEAIEHNFMVRGHSYAENDRDFAFVEKRKKSSTVSPTGGMGHSYWGNQPKKPL